MATSIGEIGLDLVVNQNRFRQQMTGVTSLAKKAGAALAAAFGTKKLIDFGKQCLELGSDLAEVQNVVDVTFPNMTAQVDKFAKSAAQSFGLSETMTKQYTGTFGAMAKAFGFTEEQAYDMGSALTGLTGDVASFYNLSQDEAYTKLKSVFTGETESLKDLGVVMTQTALDSYALANGFGKTTAQMTEAEKVSLRYAFVQSQLSAAQGDFARTSGSWANQVRILKLQFDSLKATIGQGLINLFTPIIKTVNTLIGKLATLANAFKSFTELITGNKSSGSSQVSSMGEAATDAGTGMEDASQSVDNMTEATKKAGSTAKKAAKEMRSLMGFDQIQKLDSPSDTNSDTGSTAGTGSTGASLGDAVDFGKLAEGDNTADNTNKSLDKLLKRCKELAGIFKKGFKIGFGDSEKKIKSITDSIRNIGKTLKEIFSDPSVTKSANHLLDALALSFGKMVGSFARIGLTIADNLIGGFDKYLTGSKDYIKKKLASIFDIRAEIADLEGGFYVALADIFDVFSGETAKSITADIIGIFADGILGAYEVLLKFTRDLEQIFILPVIQNVDKIKTAIENTLIPIETVLNTLHQAVVDTFEKISATYDQYVKPFMDALTQGISEIVSTFLDAYNTYLVPVLDYLADKFTSVWQEHIQPAINGIIELLGKVFELLTAVWQSVLQPLINWIAENIMPVIAPIIQFLGERILDFATLIADAVKDITDVLIGVIDFLVGVFTGDWKKAWEGIKEIGQGAWNFIKDVIKNTWELIKNIVKNALKIVKSVISTAWSGIKTLTSTIWSAIKNILSSLWEALKSKVDKIFNSIRSKVTGVWDSVKEKTSQVWENVTSFVSDKVEMIKNAITNKFEAARDAVKTAFEGIVDYIKNPINEAIRIINGAIGTINNAIGGIESAFTFGPWTVHTPFGSKTIGFTAHFPRVGTIPQLAEGGFVQKNTPQLAMIGDNRHQGEIVAPEGKLQEMVDLAVAKAGTGNSDALTGTEFNRGVMRIVSALSEMGFYLDGTQMAKANRAAQEVIDIRYNTVGVR